jgi:hypothetical protein
VSYDQLLPVFMHNPPQAHDPSNTQLPFKFSGGFGIGHSRIGTLFTLYGVVGGFIQFLVFPPAARYFGVLNCFKACGITFPLICLVTPYTALIEDPTSQQAIMFAIMIVKSFAVIFAFPCSVILLTNSAVSLRVLGTLNGVAVSISAIGRAIGPALTGAAFTWGLDKGYIVTPYFLLAVISAIGAIPIWYLEEMEGFSKSGTGSDDEEEEETLLSREDEETGLLAGEERHATNLNEEALDVVEGPPLAIDMKKRRESIIESRMSSPIGVMGGSVGRGGPRRLSNGLAASNMGQGTGGTSFT